MIIHGPENHYKGLTWQALTTDVLSQEELEQAVAVVRQDVDGHNAKKDPTAAISALSFAYRWEHAEALGGVSEGYEDGGEAGAGAKLLYILKQWDLRGVFIAVTRKDRALVMSDILGPRKFKHIVSCARRLLEDQYISRLRVRQGSTAVPCRAHPATPPKMHVHSAEPVGPPMPLQAPTATPAQDHPHVRTIEPSTRNAAAMLKREALPVSVAVVTQACTPPRICAHHADAGAEVPNAVQSRSPSFSVTVERRSPSLRGHTVRPLYVKEVGAHSLPSNGCSPTQHSCASSEAFSEKHGWCGGQSAVSPAPATSVHGTAVLPRNDFHAGASANMGTAFSDLNRWTTRQQTSSGSPSSHDVIDLSVLPPKVDHTDRSQILNMREPSATTLCVLRCVRVLLCGVSSAKDDWIACRRMVESPLFVRDLRELDVRCVDNNRVGRVIDMLKAHQITSLSVATSRIDVEKELVPWISRVLEKASYLYQLRHRGTLDIPSQRSTNQLGRHRRHAENRLPRASLIGLQL